MDGRLSSPEPVAAAYRCRKSTANGCNGFQLSSSLESSSLYQRRSGKVRKPSTINTSEELRYMILQLNQDKSEFYSRFDERLRQLEWAFLKLAPSPSCAIGSYWSEDEGLTPDRGHNDMHLSRSDCSNSLDSEDVYEGIQLSKAANILQTSDEGGQPNDVGSYGLQQAIPICSCLTNPVDCAYRPPRKPPCPSPPPASASSSVGKRWLIPNPDVLGDGCAKYLGNISSLDPVTFGLVFPFNEVKSAGIHQKTKCGSVL